MVPFSLQTNYPIKISASRRDAPKKTIVSLITAEVDLRRLFDADVDIGEPFSN